MHSEIILWKVSYRGCGRLTLSGGKYCWSSAIASDWSISRPSGRSTWLVYRFPTATQPSKISQLMYVWPTLPAYCAPVACNWNSSVTYWRDTIRITIYGTVCERQCVGEPDNEGFESPEIKGPRSMGAAYQRWDIAFMRAYFFLFCI